MLFPLLMCMKIQMQQGKLSSAHFDSFVKGGSALDISSVKKKPANWIPEMAWLHIISLSQQLPEIFKDLPESIARGDAEWKAWYDNETPEAVRILCVPRRGPLQAAFRILKIASRGWAASSS